jgi:uncharacterized protein YjdB
MARFLWNLRPYRTIQDVIDAIKNYLDDPLNIPRPPGVDDFVITGFTIAPSTVTLPANTRAQITVTVQTNLGPMPANIAREAISFTWGSTNGPNPPAVDPVATRQPFDGSILVVETGINAGPAQRRDTLTLTVRAGGTSRTAQLVINVTPPVAVTGQLAFRQNNLVMRVGGPDLNLRDPQILSVIPANATAMTWASTDNTIATVHRDLGIVTARSARPTPVTITVTANQPLPSGAINRASINIWVMEGDEGAIGVFAQPGRLALQAGASSRPGQVSVITSEPVVAPLAIRWISRDPDIATVDTNGVIRATENPPSAPAGQMHPEARIEVHVIDTNNPPPPDYPPGSSLGFATITVVVRPQIDYEITVLRSVIEDRGRGGDPYPANFLEFTPVTMDYDLPETLVWNSSNGVVMFTTDGGATRRTRVETLPNQVPQIVTDGIGRSEITVRANSEFGPEIAERKFIISAPRGIDRMDFYLDDNYRWIENIYTRRTLRMMNGETGLSVPMIGEFSRIRAEESGHENQRDMNWTVFETNSFGLSPPYDLSPSISNPTTDLLSYSGNIGANRHVLRANAMGLARVAVTPAVANIPPGWGVAEDPTGRGRWFGRSGEDLQLFVENGAGMVFNESIDHELSGLRLSQRNASDIHQGWLDWSALSYAAVNAGTQVITDVNGRRLTRADNPNPGDVWLVTKTANVRGDNEFFVWIRPQPPTFAITSYIGNGMQNAVIPLSRYLWHIENEPNEPAIVFNTVGGFTYKELFLPEDTLLPGETLVTAWTFVNDGNRETGGEPGLVVDSFRRTWGQMPPIVVDPDNPPALGETWTRRITTQMKYTTNADFRNLLGQGGSPEEILITTTHPSYPPTWVFTIVNDIEVRPVPAVRVREGDSGNILTLVAEDGSTVAAHLISRGIDPTNLTTPLTMTSTPLATLWIFNNGGDSIGPRDFLADGPGNATLSVSVGTTVVNIPFIIDPALRIQVGEKIGPLPDRAGVRSIALAPGTGIPNQAALNNATFTSLVPAILSVANEAVPGESPEFYATGVAEGFTDIVVTTAAGGRADIRVRVIPGLVDINPLSGGFIPVVGASAPILEMPGIMAASMAAGIDFNTATFESTNRNIMTVTPDGRATMHRPGRVGVRIRARDGRRTVNVTVEVMSEEAVKAQQTPVQPPPQTPVQPPPQTPIQPPPQLIPPPVLGPAAPTEILLRSTAEVGVDGTLTLIPILTPANADRESLVWTTSDAFTATVSDGLVSGWKAGTVIITASDESGTVKAECRVTVRVNSRPVTSITLNNRTMNLAVGATGSLTATVRPTNATIRGVTWLSSDEAVARVNQSGRVTSVSAGTAIITAISDSSGLIATCTVTVHIPVQAVTLPELRINLRVGETYQLRPIITPEDATNRTVSYSVASSATASVTSEGLVTARRAGTTTIRVVAGGRSVTLTVVIRN